MTRKVFSLSLGAMLFALCFSAEAQQPTKIPRIGYLASAGSAPSEAFRQGLRDLGYVEGKNVAFEFRTPDGKPERYPELAAEIVRLFNPMWKLAFFPFDETFISSAVNNPFHNCSLRDSFRNDVRNEESWLVINLGCSDAACCCSQCPTAFH